MVVLPSEAVIFGGESLQPGAARNPTTHTSNNEGNDFTFGMGTPLYFSIERTNRAASPVAALPKRGASGGRRAGT